QGAGAAVAGAVHRDPADPGADAGEVTRGPLSGRGRGRDRAGRGVSSGVEGRSRVSKAPGMDSILLPATPPAWGDAAVAGWRELLVDHANCEKKAASTAVALIFAYPEDTQLGLALSRLAREELRHFEQVQSAMTELGVDFTRQKPGRYAAGL